jgi:hypothetical protein
LFLARSVPMLPRTIAADCPRIQAAQVHDVCGVNLTQLSRLGLRGGPAQAGQLGVHRSTICRYPLL